MDRAFVLKGLKRIMAENELTDYEKETIEGAISLLNGKSYTPRLLDDGFYCASCGQCIGDRNDAGAVDFCPSCGTPFDWSID